MALNFAQKEAIVAEVAEVAKSAYSAIAAEYRGLTVEQLTKLRVEARKAGVYVRVVKNTLAKRALEDTDFACMRDGLTGPMILAFSQDDPGSVARVLEPFAKEHDKFQVRIIALGGKLLAPTEIGNLAKMPGDQSAHGDHEGSGPEARRNAQRGAGQARPHRRRDSRCQGSRLIGVFHPSATRSTVFSRRNPWPFRKTTFSKRLAT